MKKTVVITPEQVAIESNLRPGKMSEKPWRGYVAERFWKDHGCVVTDFSKLSYQRDEYDRGNMVVVGECGKSITFPQT